MTALSASELAIEADYFSSNGPRAEHGKRLLGHIAVLEKLVPVALLAGTGSGKDWHLTACRMERRNDPRCKCISECDDAREVLTALGKLP